MPPASLSIFEELGVFQSLGGDVDQLRYAGFDGFLGVARDFLCGQRRIHLLDGDLGLLGALLLVLHERDQRADDNDGLRQKERGKLVSEALACAGRHEAENAAPAEDLFEDLLLPGPEALDPEALAGFAQDLGPGNRTRRLWLLARDRNGACLSSRVQAERIWDLRAGVLYLLLPLVRVLLCAWISRSLANWMHSRHPVCQCSH